MGYDIQAVKEVFPEMSLFHGLAQVLVRGGNDPYIHIDGFSPADALEPVFLQHPENLDLEFGAHIGDLVQKNGSAVSHFKTPYSGADGAGESAFLMSRKARFPEVPRVWPRS